MVNPTSLIVNADAAGQAAARSVRIRLKQSNVVQATHDFPIDQVTPPTWPVSLPLGSYLGASGLPPGSYNLSATIVTDNNVESAAETNADNNPVIVQPLPPSPSSVHLS